MSKTALDSVVFIRRKDQIISQQEAEMFEVLKGHTASCQRRTCLKWEINGELSANDRNNLMKLLCQVDKQACIEELSDADIYDET